MQYVAVINKLIFTCKVCIISANGAILYLQLYPTPWANVLYQRHITVLMSRWFMSYQFTKTLRPWRLLFTQQYLRHRFFPQLDTLEIGPFAMVRNIDGYITDMLWSTFCMKSCCDMATTGLTQICFIHLKHCFHHFDPACSIILTQTNVLSAIICLGLSKFGLSFVHQTLFLKWWT